jgi:hypothetical protein
MTLALFGWGRLKKRRTTAMKMILFLIGLSTSAYLLMARLLNWFISESVLVWKGLS